MSTKITLHFLRNDNDYNSSTDTGPDTSKICHTTLTPFSPNIFAASFAIFSKFLVARARIVGPAPDKHMPSNPECVAGVNCDVTSGNPGI